MIKWRQWWCLKTFLASIEKTSIRDANARQHFHLHPFPLLPFPSHPIIRRGWQDDNGDNDNKIPILWFWFGPDNNGSRRQHFPQSQLRIWSWAVSWGSAEAAQPGRVLPGWGRPCFIYSNHLPPPISTTLASHHQPWRYTQWPNVIKCIETRELRNPA